MWVACNAAWGHRPQFKIPAGGPRSSLLNQIPSRLMPGSLRERRGKGGKGVGAGRWRPHTGGASARRPQWTWARRKYTQIIHFYKHAHQPSPGRLTPPPVWSPQQKGALPQAVVLYGPLEHPESPGLRLPPDSSPGTGKEAMAPRKAIPQKVPCASPEKGPRLLWPTPRATSTDIGKNLPPFYRVSPHKTPFLHIAHDILYRWPLWGCPLKGSLNVQIQDYSIVWWRKEAQAWLTGRCKSDQNRIPGPSLL